jgi:hypothetical protein
MTLEEILKASGWTDQQIADVGPMLNNAQFRSTLEQQYNTVANERDTYKQRDTEWEQLRDTVYQPQITRAEEDAAKIRMEAARLREQVQIAKDYGYLTEEQAQKTERETAAAAAAAAQNYDPKRHPTFDDVRRFADAEGEAIALAQDMAAEYAALNEGRSLYEYTAEIGGRQMRGMRALRAEAKAAGSNDLEQYIARKFDYTAKRAALAAARQKAHDDAIRKEAEEKVNSEWAARVGGNPNMRLPVPSTQPFIPSRSEAAKQPWESGTPQQNRARRISEITSKVLKEGRSA